MNQIWVTLIPIVRSVHNLVISINIEIKNKNPKLITMSLTHIRIQPENKTGRVHEFAIVNHERFADI